MCLLPLFLMISFQYLHIQWLFCLQCLSDWCLTVSIIMCTCVHVTLQPAVWGICWLLLCHVKLPLELTTAFECCLAQTCYWLGWAIVQLSMQWKQLLVVTAWIARLSERNCAVFYSSHVGWASNPKLLLPVYGEVWLLPPSQSFWCCLSWGIPVVGHCTLWSTPPC